MLALIVTSENGTCTFLTNAPGMPGGHIWSPIGPKFGIHIVAA
jgi:hypothetical protein